MTTVFSDDGRKIVGSRNQYFSDSGTTLKSGNMLYSGEMEIGRTFGRTTYTGSGIVRVSGSMIFTPKGEYKLNGDVLYGPGGKSWRNVLSVNEAKDIVLMDIVK